MGKFSGIAAAVALSLVTACGSDSSGGNPGGTASGTDGGGSTAQGTAQVRFRYQIDWNTHLGCTSVSNYKITFGATPTPVDVPIDVTDGALGQYATVDGRPYKDADVLHTYSCDGSTKENYGRFGTDLALAASKRYTVTLSGTAATVAEDP